MNVLFVCSHNAGRSQIAQALFKRAAKGHQVRSRGTAPAARIHPVVVEALAEVGVDVSRRHPQLLISEDSEWADLVVTMGCQDTCPLLPGKPYVDWDLPDPAEMDMDGVREVRESIEAQVQALAAELPDVVRSFRLADSKHSFRLEGGEGDEEVHSFRLADSKHSFHLEVVKNEKGEEIHSFQLADKKYSFRKR